MFRGSSTQLYVPAFTQKDFYYNVHTRLPTQGTSNEDLGNTILGVHSSSLQQTQHLHKRQGTTTITSTLRGMGTCRTTITTYKRDKAQSQTTTSITFTLRGIPTQPPQSPLHKRDTNKYKEGYNSW